MTVWRRSVAALGGLALAGCGLVTMASQPELDDAITRYNRALAAAGLSDLSRSVDAYLDRPIELDLVAGDYMALSEYQTIGRGPTQKVWVWLERVRVEPQSGLTLVLGHGNTLCAKALTPNGTRCRDK